jgi:mycoredoxin
MLERDLAKAAIPITRRNIWEDPDAAAAVREAAGGNETVPTVRVGEQSLVNPPLAQVVDLLQAVAPELLTRP